MEEMDTESGDMTGQEEQAPYTLKRLFTDRNLVMPLLITCALQVIQQLSGINAVSMSNMYWVYDNLAYIIYIQ